jgi:phage terminase large subunit GpA-like protein
VQIHAHLCTGCGRVEVDGRAVSRADAERLQCDAAIAEPGGRNTTTIPPRTRREVLARDRHRCQAPGCGRRRYLEVHHVVPRERGGSNDLANLVTLCSACHRLMHERTAGGRTVWQLGAE